MPTELRMKTRTLEAVQWDGHNIEEVQAFVGTCVNGKSRIAPPGEVTGDLTEPWEYLRLYDRYVDAWTPVDGGEWFVKDEEGGLWVLSDHTVTAMYERVKDTVPFSPSGDDDDDYLTYLPAEAYRRLVEVAEYVSMGRGFVGVRPYPDATARAALGALTELEGSDPEPCPPWVVMPPLPSCHEEGL